VTSAVNALGQPTSISGGGTTYASSIAYHPNGAVKSFFYGNNIVHTMEQNDRQMPDTVSSIHGSTDFLHDEYDYDGHGNVMAITDKRFGADGRRSRSMQYDGLDRLTEADAPKMYGANGVSYRYNVLDNIVSVQREVPKFSRQSYCYDSSNRLVAIRSLNCSGSIVTEMGYDVQGNLSSRDVQPYRFDYGNRLREVDGVERYRYDGHGRRVLANRIGVGNILSQYGLDGRLLYQRNERTSLTLDHVYLGASLLAIRERDVSGGAPVVKYQHTDALGSPVAVTLQDRTVAEETEYEPYGKVINRPSRDGAGYTGHVEDAATGMIQMQQRYYDPPDRTLPERGSGDGL
jgi:hypothetical protein